AMGLKIQKNAARVYTLLGDGELQEGEVWEAAMCAAHHKLDNLCAIIDYNKLQSDASNDEIMKLEPLAAKWQAFGWGARGPPKGRLVGGGGAKLTPLPPPPTLPPFRNPTAAPGLPSVIIAHTVK